MLRLTAKFTNHEDHTACFILAFLQSAVVGDDEFHNSPLACQNNTGSRSIYTMPVA